MAGRFRRLARKLGRLASGLPTPSQTAQMLAFCGEPFAALLSSARYLNQSFVAFAILSTVHRGASFHCSIEANIVATPSSNRTFGFHCRTRLIFEMSA